MDTMKEFESFEEELAWRTEQGQASAEFIAAINWGLIDSDVISEDDEGGNNA